MKPGAFKFFMNLYPLYFGTGGKILHISPDWKKVKLQLSLNLWTRNYVGTIFGGSMFSASDPFYMIMFIQNMGPDFVVWDKAATITFKRPGKGRLTADFEITDEEIEMMKRRVLEKNEDELVKVVSWKDDQGKVVSEVERVLYFATKEFYKQKRERKAK